MSDRIDTDAVLHKAMQANNLENPGHQVDLEGELYGATDKKQRAGRDYVSAFVTTAGEHVRDDMLLDLVAHNFAHWVRHLPLLVVTAGNETIEKAFETKHEGTVLNEAVKREYATAACLVFCVDALPDGFRVDVSAEFVDKGKASPGAEKVLNSIRTRSDAAEVEKGILANCRDGQVAALQRHITTAGELVTALRQNSEFAKRYHDDLAFKLGADSVIWAKAHDELVEIEGQLVPVPTPASIEVRG